MLRWLNRREIIHSLIVALFAGVVFVLAYPANPDDPYSPYRYSDFLRWINREFGKLEWASVDSRIRFGRKAKVNPQIVFLAIDQNSTPSYLDSELAPETLAASRPLTLMSASFPYSREVWALVFDRLFSAGARTVALDMWFPGPSPNDAAWKEALNTYRNNIVIAMNIAIDPRTNYSPTLSLPSPSLFPDQDPFDDRLGYVNYWPDADDVIRSASYRTNLDALNGNAGAEKKHKFYSFAARAVQKGGHPELVPDDLEARVIRYAGPPLRPFRNPSLYKIFDPDAWKGDFQNGDYFRGKIVVIGPQGDMFKDKSETPYGLMDGAEIHLNAINSLLQHDFLQRASTGLLVFSIFAAGILSLIFAISIAGIGWRFLAGLSVVGCYLITLVSAFNGPGWLLPAVAPMTVFCGSMGTGIVYDFVLTQIEKLRLRTTFERYNSKNVVKYLLENPDSYKEMLAGSRRPVTVLFSDVRGFTTTAEETPDSHQLVLKLNEYLTAMVGCVFRFDGTLDSFMGDGLMATWGAPYSIGTQGDAVRAVRTALAMMAELRRLNAKWIAEGGTAWQVGIGVNHGQVIVGDIGSLEHKEFATIGDAVNLGSRLEGLTKAYHQDIMLGEAVAELVRDTFHLRSVDLVQVKGKKQAVETFTVLGEKSEALSLEMATFMALYEEGVASFRKREFARARELFAEALKIVPDDFLAADYLGDCIELIKNPPDESWTGIRVMTTK